MRLVGLLVALGAVLAVVYFLAGDVDAMLGGRGDEAAMEPARIASDAADKVNERSDKTNKLIEELNK